MYKSTLLLCAELLVASFMLFAIALGYVLLLQNVFAKCFNSNSELDGIVHFMTSAWLDYSVCRNRTVLRDIRTAP